MSAASPLDDGHDEVVVYVPPAGRCVPLLSFEDALDFVLLLQPLDDALVALCDEHRHVLLVVETNPDHLPDVADLAGRIDAVVTAVVFTCDPVGDSPAEDDLVRWHRLRARFEVVGIELVDWLQFDDERVRSLALTAGPVSTVTRWTTS